MPEAKLLGSGQVRRLKCPLSKLKYGFFPKTWQGRVTRGPQ